MWSKLKHTCTNYMDKIMAKIQNFLTNAYVLTTYIFHAKKLEKSKKSQLQAFSNIYSHKVRLFRVWPVSISVIVMLLRRARSEKQKSCTFCQTSSRPGRYVIKACNKSLH